MIKTGHPLYDIWNTMRQRCYNPKATGFKRYGGRGIKVCDRWLESFWNFVNDIGPRPSPEHSVDRRENDGDYAPDNCHWATRIQQARNRANYIGPGARVVTVGFDDTLKAMLDDEVKQRDSNRAAIARMCLALTLPILRSGTPVSVLEAMGGKGRRK